MRLCPDWWFKIFRQLTGYGKRVFCYPACNAIFVTDSCIVIIHWILTHVCMPNASSYSHNTLVGDMWIRVRCSRKHGWTRQSALERHTNREIIVWLKHKSYRHLSFESATSLKAQYESAISFEPTVTYQKWFSKTKFALRYKLAEWRSGSVSALPCERPGFASRTRLREKIPANNCTMQGQNNWGNWGSPGVMKLWVAWEVLRWLMKFRELCSGGFHPKLVTPPYQGFLNVNTPPNSQNSKRP